MNRGSANGDAFVDWRTKCTGVLNHYIYVPSLRARACARDPTTLHFIIFYTLLKNKYNIIVPLLLDIKANSFAFINTTFAKQLSSFLNIKA
jgi:hypothetical protein